MQKLKSIISPSILNCDFSNLELECTKLISYGSDWLHIDIMDGHFVPNISIGFPIIKSMRKKFNCYFDCHCMISDPMKYVEILSNSGANQMTFHIESEIESIEKLISKIKENKMEVGIALKPKTLIDSTIKKYLDLGMVDMILIMSVEPGFGGQSFMEEVLPKVVELRKEYKYLNIQMDGGIKCNNVDKCTQAGSNVIVSGTGIIEHNDPQFAVNYMRDSINTNLKLLDF